MSAQPPSATPQMPRRTALSGKWLAVIAIGTLWGALMCTGGLATLAYLMADRTVATVESAVMGGSGGPGAVTVPVNDWWTSRVLADVYSAAVDAVVTNPQVIEKLGEPVDVDFESEELYSRENSGELAGKETIKFDIVGPKGRAEVSVVSSSGIQGMPQGMSAIGQMKVVEILVTTAEGDVVTVPPPVMKPFAPQ